MADAFPQPLIPSWNEASQDWRKKPFAVCFVEQKQPVTYTNIDPLIKYPDFLAVLHQLTTDHAHLLPGIPVRLDAGEGFSLRDGHWYCRFVHIGVVPTVDGWTTGFRPASRTEWTVMGSFEDFGTMMDEFLRTRLPNVSWIEFQHQLQFDRDQGSNLAAPYQRRGPVIVDSSAPSPTDVAYPNDGQVFVQTPQIAFDPALFLQRPEMQVSEETFTQDTPRTPPVTAPDVASDIIEPFEEGPGPAVETTSNYPEIYTYVPHDVRESAFDIENVISPPPRVPGPLLRNNRLLSQRQQVREIEAYNQYYGATALDPALDANQVRAPRGTHHTRFENYGVPNRMFPEGRLAPPHRIKWVTNDHYQPPPPPPPTTGVRRRGRKKRQT